MPEPDKDKVSVRGEVHISGRAHRGGDLGEDGGRPGYSSRGRGE